MAEKISESIICSFCENKFETFENLVFECNILTAVRNILQLTNWREKFVHMSVKTLRFTASVLNGSWQEAPEQTINYLNFLFNL